LSNYIKFLLLFAIGVIISAFIYNTVGISDTASVLLKVNIPYLTVAVVSYVLLILFWSLKWNEFIKASGFSVPVRELLTNLTVGMAVNALTPVAKMGGEPVRAYLLKKRNGIKIRIGMATIVADLGIEAINSITLIILSLFLVAFLISPPAWLLISFVFFSIVSLLLLVSLFGIASSESLAERIILWLSRRIEKINHLKGKITESFKQFQRTFRRGFRRKDTIIRSFFYGICVKLMDLVRLYMLFLSIGYTIDPIYLIIAMGLSAILLSIPATPGGLGLFEGGMIGAFVLLGVPHNIAAAVVFLERLITFWGVIVVGTGLGVYYGVGMLEKRNGKFLSR